MSIVNSIDYRRAKARVEELHELLLQLDTAAEILYTNLKYDGMLAAIQKVEDVRFKYYMEYEQNSNVLEFKGNK